MFTGIIEDIGKIKVINGNKIKVASGKIVNGLKNGDSIAVNGLCLTATGADKDSFTADIMPETMRRSNLRYLHPGESVNLERALPAGGRFGGHFVEGHVDDVGRVMSLKSEAEAVIMKVSIDPKLTKYIVEKGFVAVDGVSLTVIECDRSSFSVSLVTFTREHTTLGNVVQRKYVNIEVDILGKYVEKFNRTDKGSIIADFLVDADLSKSRWN